MATDPIKSVLTMLPYGFYSIGSRSGDELNLMVANWVTQISFTPRLLAIGLQKKAHSHSLISTGRVLTLNLFLAEDAESIMPYTKSTVKNPDKMADASFTKAPETGCPVPEGAAAFLECRVREILDIGGDHDIVVVEPVGGQVLKAAEAGEILGLPDIGWSYAG
ncbi:MAG: flavin reductase family protein [Candidatus Promineifilaceae bacterium]|nr:flavin reductase family protein [Candidatus Promineifilaceae bacterium]